MLCIFGQADKLFVSNGDHVLKPTKAIVTKEDNAGYSIEIEAPLCEIGYLQEGRIVAADTPWGRQGFRLTNPKIKTNKIVIKGNHVYFDSERYVISDSYVVDKNGNEALQHLNAATDQASPFTVESDISNTISTARIVRKTLREAVDVVVERWGGHLERDNYHISLKNTIGEDRGIVISYAKNLESLTVEENWKDVVTKIMPVGKDGIKLPEEYLYSDVQYDIPYTKVIKIDQGLEESEYENEATYQAALIDDLRNQGEAYLAAHAMPECTYTVKALLQDIADVGDIIRVKHPRIAVDILTSVTAVKWNCLTEKYESVTFGTKPRKLSGLNTSIKAAEDKINIMYDRARDELSKKLTEATGKIWSAMSDSHVIYDGDKILIVDQIPKEEAKNCIMINAGGIGFSKTGINGTFSSAWSIDGTLDMGAINVLNLTADMIKTGTLDASLVTIKNLIKAINESTGEERIYGSHVDINGKQLSSVIQDVTKSIEETLVESSMQYTIGTDKDTAPDSTAAWTETMPEPQDGEYIWQRTVSTYGDGTKKYSDPVCLSIATAGKDGRGIASVKSLYAVSSSDSEAPSEWEEIAPIMSADKPYLWSYEETTYTDETAASSSPRVIGIYGKGKDGVVYELSVTPQIISRTYEGMLRTDHIAINAFYRTGDEVVSHLYAGRLKIEESADGETYTEGYTSAADETGHDYTVTGSDTLLIRISLYASGGGSTTSANKLLARQTVTIVKEAAPTPLLTIRSTGGTVFHNGKGEIQLLTEGSIGGSKITEASYQWYKDEKLLEEETEDSYTAPASTIGSQPAVYRCDMTYQGQTYTASITLENKVEFTVSETAPEDPAINEVWLDKSDGGRVLKYWNGTDWVLVSDYKGELEQIRNEQSQLLQEASGIILQHLTDYSEKSEVAELRESILTQFAVLEGKIEMRFETAQENAMQIGDSLELFKTLFYTSISMNEEGITIGKSDSPFKSLFANDRLSFMQDGAEVAYISNNKLYITDAEIKGSLYLTNGGYRSRWYVDDKGNVCLQ